MKSYYLILLLMFCCVSASLWGQKNAQQKALQLSIGQHYGMFADQNFSPLHYRDKGMLYDLQYSQYRPQSAFTAALRFGTGTATTEASQEFTSNYILGDLRLQYMKPIKSFAENKRLYLGGQYHFYINFLDWDDQSSFSFLANHSLDISTRFDYDLNEKNSLSFSLDIPLINLVVRPPYNGFDEELDRNNNEGNVLKLITDGEWGTFNKLTAYALQVQYSYQLSERFDLQVTYQNRLYKTFETNPITHFQHQFLIGSTFKF